APAAWRGPDRDFRGARTSQTSSRRTCPTSSRPTCLPCPCRRRNSWWCRSGWCSVTRTCRCRSSVSPTHREPSGRRSTSSPGRMRTWRPERPRRSEPVRSSNSSWVALLGLWNTRRWDRFASIEQRECHRRRARLSQLASFDRRAPNVALQRGGLDPGEPRQRHRPAVARGTIDRLDDARVLQSLDARWLGLAIVSNGVREVGEDRGTLVGPLGRLFLALPTPDPDRPA